MLGVAPVLHTLIHTGWLSERGHSQADSDGLAEFFICFLLSQLKLNGCSEMFLLALPAQSQKPCFESARVWGQSTFPPAWFALATRDLPGGPETCCSWAGAGAFQR